MERSVPGGSAGVALLTQIVGEVRSVGGRGHIALPRLIVQMHNLLGGNRRFAVVQPCVKWAVMMRMAPFGITYTIIVILAVSQFALIIDLVEAIQEVSCKRVLPRVAVALPPQLQLHCHSSVYLTQIVRAI